MSDRKREGRASAQKKPYRKDHLGQLMMGVEDGWSLDQIQDLWEHTPITFRAELHLEPLQVLENLLRPGLKDAVLTKLVAMSIPTLYADRLETQGKGPRLRELKLQIGEMRDALQELERAFTTAAPETFFYVEQVFLRTKVEHGDWDGLPCVLERDSASMRHLNDLRSVLDDLLRDLPEDRGGQVSGFHDPHGANVHLGLAMEARATLAFLRLPCGVQKEGPVSEFIRFVHEAATGEVPTWADKYAAMVSDASLGLRRPTSRI